mgnify:CR=1 FL=1
MIYNLTSEYSPENEFTLNILDTDLGIPWPQVNPILSKRDANADGFLDILPNTQNIGERIILEGGYPFAKRLFNPQILINNRNGTFTEYSNKRIIDYYSSFGGFSIPYINNGFLEVMSILSSNDKVYPNKNEIYIRSEVITIDLRD